MNRLLLALVLAVAGASVGFAEQDGFDRLPAGSLDVVPPSDRVDGTPGRFGIARTSCRSFPISDVRRRIVDIAVQEWAFFGFNVVDRTTGELEDRATRRARWRRWRRNTTARARIAPSIAGYWATTPEGSWIMNAEGYFPWSAAFVSWVMCEAGLGERRQFDRAIAHHTYIDQAIRAGEAGADSPSAFTAHEIGAAAISPGDMLCSARRPQYRSIAERARQMGAGARTHCDIVVKLDPSRDRILAIGGNVRGLVSLKLLPAAHDSDHGLRPLRDRRPHFAHLKLRADPLGADALDDSQTLQTVGCGGEGRPPIRLVRDHIVAPPVSAARC